MRTYNRLEKLRRIKKTFMNIERIDRNYSQAYQDLFVLSMLNGRMDGSYLEIGAFHPINKSNTKLLEELGWDGVSIEINDINLLWEAHRRNTLITFDATKFDYELLNRKHFNYLSIDIEPSIKTFNVLNKLIYTGFTFDVITFEHDVYNILDRYAKQVREGSRAVLESHGYELKVGDVCSSTQHPFEDWWVRTTPQTDRFKSYPNWGRLSERYLLNDN